MLCAEHWGGGGGGGPGGGGGGGWVKEIEWRGKKEKDREKLKR